MAEHPTAKPLSFWLILIALIAALCVAGMVALHFYRQTGQLVQITQNGQVVGTYPLQEDRTLRYESEDGGYNLVVIQNGKVRVSEADCPDQTCVRMGATDQTAETIACLPHKLIIKVLAQDDDPIQLDGVTS